MSTPIKFNIGRIVLGMMVITAIVGAYITYRWVNRLGGERATEVWAWFRDPDTFGDQVVTSKERCNDAPFRMPTDGLIGFLWGDSFRPGHTHQGIDIFGGQQAGTVPVYVAYDGFLTRLPDWKSSVIIRIPQDPLNPVRQIWTYYTHMADKEGNSFISPSFPPGTDEIFVEAGTFIGYQGNYSGNQGNPTGVHLHFSVVKDNGRGSFLNELEFSNTYDPSPYLGLQLNAELNKNEIPVCNS